MPAGGTRLVQPTDATIDHAGALIREGRLVAFPTETVYGLGADATNDRAVAAIFAAKGRPQFNPLIVHFAVSAEVERHALMTEAGRRLAQAFWPGGLTLVLRRRDDTAISLLASAGLDTIAVRVPAHDIAHRLLAAAGRPVAAPSANLSGSVSATTAAHVLGSFGAEVALVVDGGPCPIGIESSVVDVSGEVPLLLRPGAVTSEALEAVVGRLAVPGHQAGPLRSPGLLERHYAPSRPPRLDARTAQEGEILLGFGPEAPADAANLSRSGDLAEAAANLFAMLRALDRPEFGRIAVMNIPETGLGRAINDRLRRAAAPSGPALR